MSEIPTQNKFEREPAVEPRVTALDYIGGEGGYCEPLIVTEEDGEAYVLHQAYLDSGAESGMTHIRVMFGSRDELEEAFDEVQRRLTVNQGLNWEEVNGSLGFDIPVEEFGAATTAICRVPWDKRRPRTDG